MHVAGRLTQVLTFPFLSTGAVLHDDATVQGLVADHAGPIMLALALAFLAATARLETRRGRSLPGQPSRSSAEAETPVS